MEFDYLLIPIILNLLIPFIPIIRRFIKGLIYQYKFNKYMKKYMNEEKNEF